VTNSVHKFRLRALWMLMRPKQLVKNLLVFAAPLATGEYTDLATIFQLLCGFVIFCLLSSTTYIMNDIHDRHADLLHPGKKQRPIASGQITVGMSLVLAVSLISIALALSFLIPPQASVFALAYLLSTTLYSFVFKEVPYFEMLLLSFGFVIRATYGSLIANLTPSRFFILCIFCGSLFVVAEKRLAEKRRFSSKEWWPRKVLFRYQTEHLLSLSISSGLLFIVTYAGWTVLGTNGNQDINVWRLASVLPIGFAVLRFHKLAFQDKNDAPEEILLSNKLTLASCGVWLTLNILAVLT
jgi:decaprenyl-phosphate phosphoribosyltransferase